MAREEKLFHSALTVTLTIILSKAIGFGRDMVTTAYFGLSGANDAYVSAYSLFYLPVLLFNSCISATLVPMYLEARAQKGEVQANRFASNAVNLFALAALAISAAMYALARPLTRLVYPGFDAERMALTVRLMRIMLLALAFNVTSISASSLLNAMEKYVAAQLTGFPLSLCVILASVLFSGAFGIEAVAWGVFAANILQLLILIPFLAGWFTYTPTLDFRDGRFRQLAKLALPAMLSMGVSELNHMVDHALASGLAEGTLTAMTSAFRLVTFLQGVLIVPLTTIMFSKMSRRVAERDERGALDMALSSLTTLALATLPVVAVGMLMSSDVIRFAYMRGRFTADDVGVTAGVLTFYVLGVPAFGARDFLNRMFHSLKDTRTPFVVSCMVVAINVALNLILRRIMGANGLALATSIAGYAGMTALILLLKKRFGRIGLRRILADLVKIALATAVCLAVCALMNRIVPPAGGSFQAMVRLIVCAGVAGIAYLLTCLVLRVRALGAIRLPRRR